MSFDLVTRGIGFNPKTLNEAERTLDFIASTDAIDSYDEVVEQDWDLKRFKRNPVVLFGHLSRDLPIGTCTRVEVVAAPGGKKQLECTIKFATAEANPVAEQVWQSVLQGTLRAVSVGFMPNDIRREKRDGADVYVLSKNELHEISVVPIPANPEAVAKMRSKARTAAEELVAPAATPNTQSDTGMTVAATKETIMDLAEALAQVAALKTSNAELSLQLKDAAAKAETAERQVAELQKRETERVARDRSERVELAFAQYKDAKKLSDADREAMAVILEAKPETFERLYPKVAPNQSHLQANLTERRDSVPTGTRSESLEEIRNRILRENKGLSFGDAQVKARKLFDAQRAR